MAKISIIVPVYNAEKYLDQCIGSIVNQTFSDFELILVDDGSRDQSAQMCDAWMEKDTRIKVIHKENGGPQSAVVEGIKYADSEIIGFCDSDDYVSKDYYGTLYNAFAENDVDMVCGKLNIVYDGKATQYNRDKEYVILKKNEILNDFWESSGQLRLGNHRYTKLFRKSIMLEIVDEFNPDLRMGEDSIHILLYLEKCSKICYLTNFDGYFYRQVSTSLMHHIDKKQIYHHMLWMEELKRVAEKYGHPFQICNVLNDSIMCALLYGCMASCNNIGLKIDYVKLVLSAIIDKKSFVNRYYTNLNPVLKVGFRLLQLGCIKLGTIYASTYISLVRSVMGNPIS